VPGKRPEAHRLPAAGARFHPPFTIPLQRLSDRARVVIHDGISFDLYQPVPVNEARDLHYSACGPDVPKTLAVDSGHDRPILDASKQNPCSHHMPQRGACAIEGSRDNFETATRLCRCVAPPDRAAVWSNRCRAGDGYKCASAHPPRKTNSLLVGATA